MKSLSFVLLLLATTALTSPFPKRPNYEDYGETDDFVARKRPKYARTSQPTADEPINLMLSLGTGISNTDTLTQPSIRKLTVPTIQPNKDQPFNLDLSLALGASQPPDFLPTDQPTAKPSSGSVSETTQVDDAVEKDDFNALKQLIDNNPVNRVKIARKAFYRAMERSSLKVMEYLLRDHNDALVFKRLSADIRKDISRDVLKTILTHHTRRPFNYRDLFISLLGSKRHGSMRTLLEIWTGISEKSATVMLKAAVDASDLEAVKMLLSHQSILTASNMNLALESSTNELMKYLLTMELPPSVYESATEKEVFIDAHKKRLNYEKLLETAVVNGNVDAMRIILDECNHLTDFDPRPALKASGEGSEAKKILFDWLNITL